MHTLMGLSRLFCVRRAQDVPPEVLRQREVKWLDMLGHWNKWMIKRFNKVSNKFHVSHAKLCGARPSELAKAVLCTCSNETKSK